MNCKTCIFQKIEIQEKSNFENEPYKYYCELNGFKSLSSTYKNGASFSNNSKVYYTQKQLDALVTESNICWRKIFKNNLLSTSIAGIALLMSCYTTFLRPEGVTIKTFEELVNDKIIIVIDSLKIEKQIDENINQIDNLNDFLNFQDSISSNNHEEILKLKAELKKLQGIIE